MEIIYPSLVEESVRLNYPSQNRKLVKKAEMYRMMVAKGIITENGEPTIEALEKGWVKEFNETKDLTFTEFLAIYPFFKHYDLESIQNIEGFWEIPIDLKETLLQDIKTHKLDYDEIMQVKEYLADR